MAELPLSLRRIFGSAAGPLALAICALVRPARADPASEELAQRHFEEGLALLRAGNFAEACPKLEESVRIEPAMGAKYRLAECYESSGRVASAWRLYTEVAEHARAAQQSEREADVRATLERIRPRLPWLLVRVASKSRGLEDLRLEIDGAAVQLESAGREMEPLPIDPGSHTISVTAKAHHPWSTTINSTEGATANLEIPALEPLPAETIPGAIAPRTPPPDERPADDATILSPGRITGIVVGSIGVIGLGLGTALAFVSKSQWDDALERCVGGATNRCPDDAIEDGATAHDTAVGATVALIAGGALAATGIVLWFALPPDHGESTVSVRIAPSFDGSGAQGHAFITW